MLAKDSSGNYIHQRLEGHNSEAFDLDKLIGTITRTKAYESDPEAKSMIFELLERRDSEPDFMIDTLDSANIYMNMQRAKLAKSLEEAGLSEPSIMETLSSFSISSENFGGAKGPESLENLFLNTNFFELLEEKDLHEEIIKTLQSRGSHTSDVDSVLNAYLSDFMQTGELQMRRMPTPGQAPRYLSPEAANEWLSKEEKLQETLQSHGFMRKDRTVSAFESFMRRRIAKSSAVTPTTNISDVSRISDQVFNFLAKTEQGQQRISLQVDANIVSRIQNETKIDLGLTDRLQDGRTGSIYFDKAKGKYFFNDSESVGGLVEIETSKAQRAIQHVMEQARYGEKEDFNLGKFTIRANPYEESIQNISFTEIEATQFDRTVAAQQVIKGRTRGDISTTSEELASTLRTTTEAYGAEHPTIPGKVVYRAPLVGEKTIEGLEKTTAYSQSVYEAGLPFADLEPSARILAVNEARASAQLGQIAYSEAMKGPGVDASKKALYGLLADEAVYENVHEIGLQHLLAQGKEDVFGMVREIGGDTPRSIALSRNSYFRTPIKDVTGGSERIIMNADDLFQLSIPNYDSAGKEVGRVQVGSKEFKQNFLYNRFKDSAVKDNRTNIINRYLTPEGLGQAGYEDLAEQVLTLQTRRLSALKESGAYISAKTGQEMRTLATSIFGTTNEEHSVKLLAEMAEKETREERLTFLRNVASQRGLHEEHFVRLYNEHVTHVAESVKRGGIGGLKFQDIVRPGEETGIQVTDKILEAREAVQASISASIDTGNESVYRLVDTVDSGVHGTVAAVMSGPFNPTIVEATSEVGENVGVRMYEEEQRALSSLETVAKKLREKPTIGKVVSETVSKEKTVGETLVEEGANFFKANKKTAYFTLAAVAAAGVGYKIAKKKNENDLYESTIEAQPVEQGQRPYGIQEAMMNGKKSSKRNPMATAGVVGNLDRNKIGHTKMGSDKHGNLFKTAAYHLL